MKTNLGVVDRTAGTLLAGLMGVFYLWGIIHGTVAMGLFIVSIFTVTSLLGIILYPPVGLSTLPLKVVESKPVRLG